MFLFRYLGLSLYKDDVSCEIKLLRAINHFWIVISVVIFAFILKNYVLTREFLKLSDVFEFSIYTMAFFAHLVILVQTQLARRKDEIWHRKLKQVEELLCNHFDARINQNFIMRWNLLRAMLIFTCTSFCFIVNVCYAMRSSDFVFLLSAHDYCLKTIIDFRYLQNSIRIDLIKQHFLVFHKAIRKVVERNQVVWKLIFVVDKFNQQYDHPIKMIDDAKDVLIFKRIHAVLCESTKLLENCFGWSLLGMLSFTFIDLTSNFYWFCLAFLHIDERFKTIDCIADIVPPILAVSFLTYSAFDMGRKTREKVMCCALKLHTNTSSEYNVLVKELLLQLYHEKIENSANDFFLVDNKLFSAVSISFNPLKPMQQYLREYNIINIINKSKFHSYTFFSLLIFRC